MTDTNRNDINRICGDVLWHESMKKHTTFKVGGEVECYASPASVDSLIRLVKYCIKNHISFYVVGNGSNLLVCDEGLSGVVIHVGKNLNTIKFKDNYSDIAGCKIPENILPENKKIIVAGAGIMLSALSAFALKHSLQGLEFASGIPGTLGGAFVMNAGAYDGEISQVCLGSVVYDIDNDKVLFLDNKDQEFGYRSSIYQKKGYVLLYGIMALESGVESEIRAKIDDYSQRRRSKQPLNMPSAGSTFKRPEGAYAGKLIEDCGLRGYTIGGAQVSEKHCGFVVNTGNATCSDIVSLIKDIQNKVKSETGFILEPEVKYLGEGNVFCK
ncbi:MAG: UDP-N-acetylmuramate dehydrogenase [Ruminococcaceae bacterium]|nr:UDP-N-acetylmuramate dehydrogenase [Oscillospiraceae bacterium]